ncbi:MAG TPA: malonate decarboxylase subunit alpha [Bryobacteraceae bacterium]|nr:malonate decarboxylase subunit alpha [Bryobacteraceae bacterium]
MVLVCAEKADREGNLFTGPNTEDTPAIVEAAALHDAIVIVQVNQIVEKVDRIDIPGLWIDIVMQADKPFAVEPLFTRDPRHVNDLQILTGMMVIRGVYKRHQVRALNHGIGFTADVRGITRPARENMPALDPESPPYLDSCH